ncbi:kinesin-like protein KIF20B [Platysternon megacephalum]|uniref:Kinesin-like protein KIF20B n=1 Tax=Platysternon megacephalum TaxID=55544 RepID=A0A4D9DTK1_9SAUR|nr:kinesin-like protein KIF20B [Platysternon megacephalum]
MPLVVVTTLLKHKLVCEEKGLANSYKDLEVTCERPIPCQPLTSHKGAIVMKQPGIVGVLCDLETLSGGIRPTTLVLGEDKFWGNIFDGRNGAGTIDDVSLELYQTNGTLCSTKEWKSPGSNIRSDDQGEYEVIWL